MPKYVSVAEAYAIYEVEEDIFEILASGTFMQPPAIVLEVLSLSGKAKKIATIGASSSITTSDDDDDEPPEGEGPWVE